MTTFNPVNESVTYKGKVIAKTASAVLFLIVPEGQEYSMDFEKENLYDKHWFPYSQVKKVSSGSELLNTLDTLIVSQWIAKKKGLLG